VRFLPGFLQEQDFPRSNLIPADHVGEKLVYREHIPLREILLLREILV
jgi:hypothetical protein